MLDHSHVWRCRDRSGAHGGPTRPSGRAIGRRARIGWPIVDVLELGPHHRYDISSSRRGDGHPQPHTRQLLRQGQLLGVRRLPGQGPGAGRRRRRLPRRGRRQGRPRRRGHRGGGARAGGARRRGPGRPIRPPPLHRHVAGLGREGVLRGRCGRRQRHQRLRRSRLPGGVRRPPGVGGGHPHPARAACRRSRPALRRSPGRRAGVPRWSGLGGRPTWGSRGSGS